MQTRLSGPTIAANVDPAERQSKPLTTSVRGDFPLLIRESTTGRPSVYLDNAATTLKPQPVIDAISAYYREYTSNVGRANHQFAEIVNAKFESCRENVASFMGAKKREVIFTSGCTDSINLASMLLNLERDDEVVVSILEHHSNYLPWQSRARVKTVLTDGTGVIDLDRLRDAITPRTRLVALTYLSNVTGNVQPVREAIRIARERGVLVFIDAAQAMGHFPVDVTELGCDFLAFSAHKMLGPTGVGVLYIREDLHRHLRPVRYGGGMVSNIKHGAVTYRDGPAMFEAGTPNIEGILAFGAAVSYIQRLGLPAIAQRLNELEQYGWKQLSQFEELIFPFPRHADHAAIFTFRPRSETCDLSFLVQILSDTYGIALNQGYQCSQPLYEWRGVRGAIRTSLYFYNTFSEIDQLVDGLRELRPFFA